MGDKVNNKQYTAVMKNKSSRIFILFLTKSKTAIPR